MLHKLFLPGLLIVTFLVVVAGLWLERNAEVIRSRRAARREMNKTYRRSGGR